MAKTPREALETLQKQYARQNEYIKNNYDRITVTMPKGTRDRIKSLGFSSVNGFISALITDKLEELEAVSSPDESATSDRIVTSDRIDFT